VELGEELVPTRVLRARPETASDAFPDQLPDDGAERPAVRVGPGAER